MCMKISKQNWEIIVVLTSHLSMKNNFNVDSYCCKVLLRAHFITRKLDNGLRQQVYIQCVL